MNEFGIPLYLLKKDQLKRFPKLIPLDRVKGNCLSFQYKNLTQSIYLRVEAKRMFLKIETFPTSKTILMIAKTSLSRFRIKQAAGKSQVHRKLTSPLKDDKGPVELRIPFNKRIASCYIFRNSKRGRHRYNRKL